jgi:aspartyl protease family protein
MTMPGPWENLPDPIKPPGPARQALRQASRLGLFLWLAVLIGLTLLLFALNSLFPNSLGGGNTTDLLQMMGWFALVSSGLLFVRRVNLKHAARTTLIWIGIAGVLVLGYAWRDPLLEAGRHLRGQLLPGYPVASGPRELTLSEDNGGGYHVIGSVNGVAVRFLIDTGASDIVLTGADARAAGIDLETLDYSRAVATANGIASSASTMVKELKVGNIVLTDVRVSVQRDGLSVSLLGMSFLGRLKSFGFDQHKMILRW